MPNKDLTQQFREAVDPASIDILVDLGPNKNNPTERIVYKGSDNAQGSIISYPETSLGFLQKQGVEYVSLQQFSEQVSNQDLRGFKEKGIALLQDNPDLVSVDPNADLSYKQVMDGLKGLKENIRLADREVAAGRMERGSFDSRGVMGQANEILDDMNRGLNRFDLVKDAQSSPLLTPDQKSEINQHLAAPHKTADATLDFDTMRA